VTMSKVLNNSLHMWFIDSPNDNRLSSAWFGHREASFWQNMLQGFADVAITNQVGHGAQCYYSEIMYGQGASQNVYGCQ